MRHKQIPYDTVLGQMVTIREDGRERRVTAAEAFLLQLTQKGLAGDSISARASLEAIEAARAKTAVVDDGVTKITVVPISIGADAILRPLGIAVKKFATDELKVRWQLKPWIVEAALARLGSRRLGEDEQREVWQATLTPHKVAWPDWWVVTGE